MTKRKFFFKCPQTSYFYRKMIKILTDGQIILSISLRLDKSAEISAARDKIVLNPKKNFNLISSLVHEMLHYFYENMPEKDVYRFSGIIFKELSPQRKIRLLGLIMVISNWPYIKRGG